MAQKLMSRVDGAGFFLREAWAWPSPREEGVWLVPEGCVDVPPPL